MQALIACFKAKFAEREKERGTAQRNIGAELKFPAVYRDGSAVSLADISGLWRYFQEKGWELLHDGSTAMPIGVRRREKNGYDVLGTETGFCKIEFSPAYVGNLFDLAGRIDELRHTLADYVEKSGVYLLGLGIHPLTPPKKELVMKKSRNLFWDKAFANERVYLFTVTAANQAHVDISVDEAADAINVFNGLSGAQIALTANSSVWQGQIDWQHKAVEKAFWDWWLPNGNRVGMPAKRFNSLQDYIETICELKPVFILREGRALGIHRYDSFKDYYLSKQALAEDEDGSLIEVAPSIDDFELHSTFCWYDARISRYCTLENRLNDQQPPEEMMVIPALTLGLAENLAKARALVDSYSWAQLIDSRKEAVAKALAATVRGEPIGHLCRQMLAIAEEGLKKRGWGEEAFLAPLWARLEEERIPADRAEECFAAGGGRLLVQRYGIQIECRVMNIPNWLRFEKGVNEKSKVLFLDIRGRNLDLNKPKVKKAINGHLREMLNLLDVDKLSEPALIKCHIGEPKCTTRMIPDFALSSIEFLKEHGIEHIVAGDSTTVYRGERGYQENPPGDVSRYLELAEAHGWAANSLGIPYVILDRPETSIPGVFEFDSEQQVKTPSVSQRYKEFYLAGGFDAAGTIINHVHFTLHLLAHVALAVKGLTMGGASRRGKLQMHQFLLPEIDEELCSKCGKCARDCPEHALVWEKGDIPVVIADKCTGCGQCAESCYPIANCIELVAKGIGEWKRGEETLPFRMVDYLLGVLDGKWDGLINIAHLYNITEQCDCANRKQKPIAADIGFLVGRNPFAVDSLSRDLFNLQMLCQKEGRPPEGIVADDVPNMVTCFYPKDLGKASLDYARNAFGLVVEPEVLRIEFD